MPPAEMSMYATPVVLATAGDDLGLGVMAGYVLVLAGHLDGYFHRFRATTAEQGAVEGAGREIGQLLGQEDSGDAPVSPGVDVGQLGHLLADGGSYLRPTMADVLQEKPGHGINVFLPIDVIDVAAFALGHDLRAAWC